MNCYKITFSNGDSITTNINLGLNEAREYYFNNWFNFGDTEDNPRDIMAYGVMIEEVA